jgi:REP element-mobilizing transposase RayT
MYEQRFQRSKELMNRDPVYLTCDQRTRVLNEFVRCFQKLESDIVAISIDRIHFHVLLRAPNHNPRHPLGLAKKESSAYMKRDAVGPHGGLWGTRTECKPVADERHFERVIAYILNHATRGAVVWRGSRTPPPLFDFDPDRLRVD